MARINVEDSIFKENRFIELAMALGGKSQAIGALVSAFFVAQRFWFPNKNKIPRSVWTKEKLSDDLINTDWAVEQDGEVYVRGSEEQFAWLFQKQQAGKRSAEIKGKLDQHPLTPVEQPLTNEQRTSTSLLFTPFSSLSSQNSDSSSLLGSQSASASEPEFNLVEIPQKRKTTNPINAETWEAYREVYKGKYGEDPVRNQTVNSQIASLVKRLGADAPHVAAFYVRHNKQFYVQSMHPVGLLLKDAEGLRTQWATGKTMTTIQAKHAETADFHKSQMDRVLRGEL